MFVVSLAILVLGRITSIPWWLHQLAMIVLVLHVIWFSVLFIMAVNE